MSNRETEQGASGSLPQEEIFELLANERRRHVLACLFEHDSLPLPDLADEVALREHNAPLPQIPEDDVLQVYLSLWHSHIPKLADANVVTYHQARDIVELAENAAPLQEYISVESPTTED